jgi:hypothetical protein
MKIEWSKSPIGLEGYVGNILCFHIIPEGNLIQLVCELPEASPNMYGRLVTHHHSAKEAGQRAQDVLDNWYKRFTQ